MELRIAAKKDLLELKVMFENIIENMYKNNIKIWNEYYPYEEFIDGIESKSLYLLTNKEEIVAAFGLCNSAGGQDCFEWKDKNAQSLYLSQVGVNIKHTRQGVGGLVLKCALDIAKQKNATYLRLMVVDINKPAINLYLKNGFEQVSGLYNEFSESLNTTISELGFEIEVCS